MEILYFDCSSGISGNMVLGALTEIVDDETCLINELKKLDVDGYRIKVTKRVKNGITGTHVDVIVDDKDEYGHIHRSLDDINTIIDNSSLNDNIKNLAKRIFQRVAKAKSRVHNKPLSEVHFHEVGAIDSIVDIVGAAILIDRIHPDRIIASIVNEGYGFIECAHGTMSVPVPATSEIFVAAGVKFRQIDIDTELVTPTGAAIIAELAQDFVSLPAMVVKKTGWGAGTKELRIPNLLKVYLGTIDQSKTHNLEQNTARHISVSAGAQGNRQGDRNTDQSGEDFVVMETNIDDCSGEILGYTMEKLIKQGALDVFYTPVFMKKNRPAYLLTVTCRRTDMTKLQDIIFCETTTIGIRYRYENRTKLDREAVVVDTKYGKVKGKKVLKDGKSFVYPEYESLKEIAGKSGIPIKELYKLELSD